MIMKLSFCFRHNFSSGDPERAQQPGENKPIYSLDHHEIIVNQETNHLKRKSIISKPLMIENPVRSPMVPPIADSMSTNLADLSFVILSNVGVSKNMRTYLKLFFH